MLRILFFTFFLSIYDEQTNLEAIYMIVLLCFILMNNVQLYAKTYEKLYLNVRNLYLLTK